MKLSTNESTVMTRALCRLDVPGLEVGGQRVLEVGGLEVLTISEEDWSTLQTGQTGLPPPGCVSQESGGGHRRDVPRLWTASSSPGMETQRSVDCSLSVYPQERCAWTVSVARWSAELIIIFQNI